MNTLNCLANSCFTALFTAMVCLCLPPARAADGADATAGKPFFNVRDFGAAGEGETLDSPAINRAIQA